MWRLKGGEDCEDFAEDGVVEDQLLESTSFWLAPEFPIVWKFPVDQMDPKGQEELWRTVA